MWFHAGHPVERRQRADEGGGADSGTDAAESRDGGLGRMTRKRKYLSGRIRRQVWERFNKKCQICGCETVLFGHTTSPFQKDTPCAVDHIKPFSKGGTCTDDNFQLLCITCNSQKRDKYDPSN